jgi:DNA repair protein RecO
MYHIHHTTGVIIQTYPHGEANNIYLIFTKELGMVRVHGQSVRLDRSKLRPHLASYAIKEFSLVRGKEIWRLTSVKDTEEYSADISGAAYRKAAARVFAVFARLVNGEEKHSVLFDVLARFLTRLSRTQTPETDLEAVEMITVFRILYELGYISKKAPFETLLDSDDISPGMLILAQTERKQLAQDINAALKASQL